MRATSGLVIRPEQVEAFQPAAEEAFITRTLEHLLENHAQTVVHLQTGVTSVGQLPRETLREMVENAVARARSYGISWKSTLKSFVVLMFVVAPNFDEYPLIKYVLKDKNVEANLRVDQLWERTTEEDWIAAKQSYDAAAWSAEFSRDER